MLVITRKLYEEIVIDEQIVIRIVKTGRTTVGVGIEANGHHVRRGELAPLPGIGPQTPNAGTETTDARPR